MEGDVILNIAGVPSDDFIEEVTGSQDVKRNSIFFALLTDGLPGDPAFGVGIGDLVGEQNTGKLKTRLERRASNTLPNLVSGIAYKGIAASSSEQTLQADLLFVDLDSNKDLFIPIGFAKE
jgi:hypothetical protein